MSAHVADELPRLLTGEASRDAVIDAAVHLRECADCQQELVSAVVAHASLTSAHRFAPEIVGRSAQAPEQTAQPAAALPDMSAVFEQVRTEVTTSGRTSRRRPLYAVAAVAAGVLIGGGGTVLVSHLGESTPSARTVALSAFGSGTTSAQAQIVDQDQLKVDAASLPSLDAQHRYEVWLTDASGRRMRPVGWIGSNGKADLTVPSSLLKSYSAIQVSVQDVASASYVYSGVSVLRGSYRT
ncbi:MAG: hypothetical protein ACR2LF_02470 [Jatrophihabitantaceae bacterium]